MRGEKREARLPRREKEEYGGGGSAGEEKKLKHNRGGKEESTVKGRSAGEEGKGTERGREWRNGAGPRIQPTWCEDIILIISVNQILI